MTPETTATRPPQLAVLPDPSGLLCGIMENPEDDVRRLIYADWLDEQGGGTGRNSSAPRSPCSGAGCLARAGFDPASGRDSEPG